jgi:hypothetical protein
MNYKTEEESFSAPEDEVSVYSERKRKKTTFKKRVNFVLRCLSEVFFPEDKDIKKETKKPQHPKGEGL